MLCACIPIKIKGAVPGRTVSVYKGPYSICYCVAGNGPEYIPEWTMRVET